MVDLNLRKLSAPIEALRSDVDAAYKRLDSQWKAIAKQLSKLPIPCTVGHTFDQNAYGPECTALEWRKWKGSKRICIVSYFVENTPDGPEDTWQVTPYEEWSGEQRLAMLRHVPALFEAAEKQTKKFVSQISELGGAE